jgi:ribosomal protein S27AE
MKVVYGHEPKMERHGSGMTPEQASAVGREHCPECGNDWHCPCPASGCNPRQEDVGWSWNDNDTQTCNRCGLTEHVDWWFELDMARLKKE